MADTGDIAGVKGMWTGGVTRNPEVQENPSALQSNPRKQWGGASAWAVPQAFWTLPKGSAD